jgi:hypothetical protein
MYLGQKIPPIYHILRIKVFNTVITNMKDIPIARLIIRGLMVLELGYFDRKDFQAPEDTDIPPRGKRLLGL